MRKAPVAPITGAWIETSPSAGQICQDIVAPITGAWIETFVLTGTDDYAEVAPITGAWIETVVIAHSDHPGQRRTHHGCVDRNLQTGQSLAEGGVSHPSRVRGSKPAGASMGKPERVVAPITGAWIETPSVT